jgi:hypothetical protein
VYAAISPKNGTQPGSADMGLGSSASAVSGGVQSSIYAAMNGGASSAALGGAPGDKAGIEGAAVPININPSPQNLAHYKVRLLELCRKHGVDLRTIEWFCLPENAIFWETLARKLEEIDRRSTMGDGHFKVKNPSAWLTKFFNTIKKQNAGLLASTSAISSGVSAASVLAPMSSAASSAAGDAGRTLGRQLTERDLALLSSGNPAAGVNPALPKHLATQLSNSFSDAGLGGLPGNYSNGSVIPKADTNPHRGTLGEHAIPPGLGHTRVELPAMSPEEARRLAEGM